VGDILFRGRHPGRSFCARFQPSPSRENPKISGKNPGRPSDHLNCHKGVDRK
jgi:hypothetical protein